jgi:hypothetical protein
MTVPKIGLPHEDVGHSVSRQQQKRSHTEYILCRQCITAKIRTNTVKKERILEKDSTTQLV